MKQKISVRNLTRAMNPVHSILQSFALTNIITVAMVTHGVHFIYFVKFYFVWHVLTDFKLEEPLFWTAMKKYREQQSTCLRHIITEVRWMNPAAFFLSRLYEEIPSAEIQSGHSHSADRPPPIFPMRHRYPRPIVIKIFSFHS